MSDYIDRQAALHYIADWQYGEAKVGNEAVYDTIEKCYKMIEQLPSVQPRWIPVTERLPEYDFTDVLICLHDVRHGCEDDYYIIQAYTVRGHWKPTLDINMDDLDVVAWIPVPELYAER